MTISDKGWFCDIKAEGCNKKAVASWMCKVEGIQLSACRPCYDGWIQRAALDPTGDLAQHCPRCEKKPTRVSAGTLGASVPAAVGPLTGVIADAIEMAMHKEGILGPLRQKVLTRLATEEPWMNAPAPETAAAS